MGPLRVGFFSSHNGSNVRAVVGAIDTGVLRSQPLVIIGNNSDSKVAEFAHQRNIPFRHLSGKNHRTPKDLDAAICQCLQEFDVEIAMLLGYMKKVGPQTLSAFRGRMLNIHPALLPKYGGTGMYGSRVHEEVLRNHEQRSGATIHVVTEDYDRGPIVCQQSVDVHADDSVESLAARVLKVEHFLVVDVLRRIETGELNLPFL